MGISRSQYNETITTSSAHAVAFGFPAVRVQVALETSGPIYLNFDSTALGTSDGFPMSTGYPTNPFILDDGFAISGLGIWATSTGLSIQVLGLSG